MEFIGHTVIHVLKASQVKTFHGDCGAYKAPKHVLGSGSFSATSETLFRADERDDFAWAS